MTTLAAILAFCIILPAFAWCAERYGILRALGVLAVVGVLIGAVWGCANVI